MLPSSERPLSPELSPLLEWVNAQPQTVRAHRGRLLMLVFWQAGQACSHNLLSDISQLLSRHGDSLSVLGVHCPKFEYERAPKAVLKAVNRLGLRFPVASDPGFVAWQHFEIKAWPSLVLIDTHGRIVSVEAGDAQRAGLAATIDALLEEALLDGSLTYEPQPVATRAEPRFALQFPAGLAVSPEHLYVVDSGHHRILECTLEGQVQREFGSGHPGFLDGPGPEAGFWSPRGICLLGDALFVADTGNHALRRIRLKDGEVETLAGNGAPGSPRPSKAAATPSDMVLDAPWDVAGQFDRLYISMAGSQQLWEFNLGERRLDLIAGSGKTEFRDGVGQRAGFGQPAGLALVQQALFVADSGASAVRTVQTGNGTVQTLVGHGLYEFGDADGVRSVAKLQSPQGLCSDPRVAMLWVSDTYNDCIRALRLGGSELRKLDLDYRLHEPTGIAALPGVLYVSNSAAHEVIRIDIESGVARRLPVGE